MLVVPGKVGRHEVLIARHPSARKPQAAGLQRRSSDRSDRARSSHLLQPPSSPPVEDEKVGIEAHPCALQAGRDVKIAPLRAGAGRRKRRLHTGSAEGELRGKGSSWQLTKSVLAKLKRLTALTSAWKTIFVAQFETLSFNSYLIFQTPDGNFLPTQGSGTFSVGFRIDLPDWCQCIDS